MIVHMENFLIEIKKSKEGFKYKNKIIKFYSERDPSNLPWKKLKLILY